LHNHKEFNELISIVANNMSIAPALVENVGQGVISESSAIDISHHYPAIYIRNAPARGNCNKPELSSVYFHGYFTFHYKA
jgi:hypothetical protein